MSGRYNAPMNSLRPVGLLILAPAEIRRKDHSLPHPRNCEKRFADQSEI
jgi:hypothetical protein